VISCAAVVVFGALTGVQASKVAAGEATPWLGLLERLSIGAWLLWMAVLAVMLMTGRSAAPVRAGDAARSTEAGS
jgi:hypothetical protein